MRWGGARKRRDASEPAIMDALKAAGWSVQQVHIPGGPDLLCGAHGTTHLIECKSAKKGLRDRQTEWHKQWQGGPVHLCRTVDDALSVVREAMEP